MLYNMWNNVVGTKFSQKSKPYSMIGKTLVIACQTPAVAQELLLLKLSILEKIQPYLEALKLKVTDIKFDSKRWTNEKKG